MHSSSWLFRFVATLMVAWPGWAVAQDSLSPAPPLPEVNVQAPNLVRAGQTVLLELRLPPGVEAERIVLEKNGQPAALAVENGQTTYALEVPEPGFPLEIQINGRAYEPGWKVVSYPPWLSILPPLIVIVFALVFREVILSLFLGIFFGAAVLGYAESGRWTGVFGGFLAVVDTYVKEAIMDEGHVAIIVFTLLISGMVALISRNGGMQGIVNHVAKLARTAKSGQLATWLLGLVIFFDDYANTLVVGNTMRGITDRLRISREKLAYLVDSTAAPVAALAFVTTWIGAELGYIADGIATLEDLPQGQSPYTIFLASLPYAFYPLLTLAFMPMLILLGRDFGPMHKAERRARLTGEVSRAGARVGSSDELSHFQPGADLRIRAYNALIPVLVLVLGVIAGLVSTGYDPAVWADSNLSGIQKVSQTIGSADSYAALLWASLGTVAVALLLTQLQGRFSLLESMDTLTGGFKAMMGAIMILVLAWGLQALTEDMHAAAFMTDQLGGRLSPYGVPALTFLLGALVSFATGSSWGTMAILYPLLIPLSWTVARSSGLSPAEALPILYNTVSCVLAGSVLGDHCSPVADTTILSSLSTSCDHIDHVRTQLPYALSVGVVGVLLGTLPISFGVPAWICYPVALAALFALARFVGKPVE